MKQVKIENWYFTFYEQDPYLAPELRTQVLGGDTTREDGSIRPVITSAIQGKRGENVITMNTEYILGKVAADYEAQYPGAKERFLNSAQEV